MEVTCTKIEAATRQLDEAIFLMFTGHDPLAVHTLAAAARGIFADLLELSRPGASTRTLLEAEVMESHGLSQQEARDVFHWIPNYLKHADRDPGAVLLFTEEATDHLIFGCIYDCMQLEHPLSCRMKAYALWYSACYPESVGEKGPELVGVVGFSIPDMHKKSREEQLAWGVEIEQSLRPK